MTDELSKHIPASEIPLLAQPKHFIEWHYRICKYFNSQIDAYEALESYYQVHFRRRKYSSYESFKTIRQRMVRSRAV